MLPTQSRLVLSKIELASADNATRIRYAKIYHEGLSGLPELILPQLRTDEPHIYTCYPIQYKDRRTLARWMISHRRDLAIQHIKNSADLPALKDFHRDCPKTKATENEVIMLPIYPRYTQEQVEENLRQIRAFLGK